MGTSSIKSNASKKQQAVKTGATPRSREAARQRTAVISDWWIAAATILFIAVVLESDLGLVRCIRRSQWKLHGNPRS